MKLETTIAFILFWAFDETGAAQNGNLTISEGFEPGNEQAVSLHSRRKRYIVFPKGSSLQMLLELLVHVPTQFRVVVGPTLQVAWPLPSGLPEAVKPKKSTPDVTSENFFRFPTPGKKYKIFSDVATLMDYGGANGRQCVLKALCESGQRTPSKKEFLQEVLHKIFSVDGEESFEEHPDDKLYRKAHQSTNQNCETLYPECQFSIFNEFK